MANNILIIPLEMISETQWCDSNLVQQTLMLERKCKHEMPPKIVFD